MFTGYELKRECRSVWRLENATSVYYVSEMDVLSWLMWIRVQRKHPLTFHSIHSTRFRLDIRPEQRKEESGDAEMISDETGNVKLCKTTFLAPCIPLFPYYGYIRGVVSSRGEGAGRQRRWAPADGPTGFVEPRGKNVGEW